MCFSDISEVPKGTLFDEPMIFVDTSYDKSTESKEKMYRYSYANECKLFENLFLKLFLDYWIEKHIFVGVPRRL